MVAVGMSGTLPSGSDDPGETDRSEADTADAAESADGTGASGAEGAARGEPNGRGGRDGDDAGTERETTERDTADREAADREAAGGTGAAGAGGPGTPEAAGPEATHVAVRGTDANGSTGANEADDADDTTADDAEPGTFAAAAPGAAASERAANAADTAGTAGAPEAADAPETDSPESGNAGGVRVCWLNDDDADDLIGALAPETARTILSAVHETPRTASELAETADTSVQNVRHHVSKLTDAGLVEAVDTRYSVKGREMTVYGPPDDRVVVAVGGESERSSLLDSLGGLSGAAAVLAGASLLVQALFGAGVRSLSGPATAPRVGDSVGTTGGALLGTLPPGVAFLAGGLLVLATVLAVDRLRGGDRRRGPMD